jgi:hypothetical protein
VLYFNILLFSLCSLCCALCLLFCSMVHFSSNAALILQNCELIVLQNSVFLR